MKKIIERLFGFRIVRIIFGFIVFIWIIQGIMEYDDIQERKKYRQEKLAQEVKEEEEKKYYESLPLDEKIKLHVESRHYAGDFVKYENNILYINRLLSCEDANAGGKTFGTMAGSVWWCQEECSVFMKNVYYISLKFPQIEYVNYTFNAEAKDEYGYKTMQKRGSFKINIEKEEFRRYKTPSDLRIHSSTMDACRNAQFEELGDWVRTD